MQSASNALHSESQAQLPSPLGERKRLNVFNHNVVGLQPTATPENTAQLQNLPGPDLSNLNLHFGGKTKPKHQFQAALPVDGPDHINRNPKLKGCDSHSSVDSNHVKTVSESIDGDLRSLNTVTDEIKIVGDLHKVSDALANAEPDQEPKAVIESSVPEEGEQNKAADESDLIFKNLPQNTNLILKHDDSNAVNAQQQSEALKCKAKPNSPSPADVASESGVEISDRLSDVTNTDSESHDHSGMLDLQFFLQEDIFKKIEAKNETTRPNFIRFQDQAKHRHNGDSRREKFQRQDNIMSDSSELLKDDPTSTKLNANGKSSGTDHAQLLAVTSKIGSGGFGRVYSCRCQESRAELALKVCVFKNRVQRECASKEVKFLSLLKDAEYVVNLNGSQEVKNGAAKDHSSKNQKMALDMASKASKLRALGATESKVNRGAHLILMELAPLGCLNDYLSKSQFGFTGYKDIPLLLRERLFFQMSSAVEAVHDLGILHADVKLNNYLVFPGEGNGCFKTGSGFDKCNITVKLSDFGISQQLVVSDSEEGSENLKKKNGLNSGPGAVARMESEANVNKDSHSSSGNSRSDESNAALVLPRRIGTVPYMAPEVALANRAKTESSNKVGRGIDIWSLGICFYRILYEGQFPDKHTGTTCTELLLAICDRRSKIEYPKQMDRWRGCENTAITVTPSPREDDTEVVEVEEDFESRCLNLLHVTRGCLDEEPMRRWTGTEVVNGVKTMDAERTRQFLLQKRKEWEEIQRVEIENKGFFGSKTLCGTTYQLDNVRIKLGASAGGESGTFSTNSNGSSSTSSVESGSEGGAGVTGFGSGGKNLKSATDLNSDHSSCFSSGSEDSVDLESGESASKKLKKTRISKSKRMAKQSVTESNSKDSTTNSNSPVCIAVTSASVAVGIIGILVIGYMAYTGALFSCLKSYNLNCLNFMSQSPKDRDEPEAEKEFWSYSEENEKIKPIDEFWDQWSSQTREVWDEDTKTYVTRYKFHNDVQPYGCEPGYWVCDNHNWKFWWYAPYNQEYLDCAPDASPYNWRYHDAATGCEYLWDSEGIWGEHKTKDIKGNPKTVVCAQDKKLNYLGVHMKIPPMTEYQRLEKYGRTAAKRRADDKTKHCPTDVVKVPKGKGQSQESLKELFDTSAGWNPTEQQFEAEWGTKFMPFKWKYCNWNEHCAGKKSEPQIDIPLTYEWKPNCDELIEKYRRNK